VHGAIPPLPNAPSWRGTQKKLTDYFTFTIIIYTDNQTNQGKQINEHEIGGACSTDEGNETFIRKLSRKT